MVTTAIAGINLFCVVRARGGSPLTRYSVLSLAAGWPLALVPVAVSGP
jgi:hypothetical protein